MQLQAIPSPASSACRESVSEKAAAFEVLPEKPEAAPGRRFFEALLFAPALLLVFRPRISGANILRLGNRWRRGSFDHAFFLELAPQLVELFLLLLLPGLLLSFQQAQGMGVIDPAELL